MEALHDVIEAGKVRYIGASSMYGWQFGKLQHHTVQEVANARGVTMAQVALAWVLTNPIVSAPIVGATKAHRLSEAVAALDLRLTSDEITALEAPYTNEGPSWL